MDDTKAKFSKVYIGISYTTDSGAKLGSAAKEIPLTEVVAKVEPVVPVVPLDGAVLTTATMGIAVAAAAALF